MLKTLETPRNFLGSKRPRKIKTPRNGRSGWPLRPRDPQKSRKSLGDSPGSVRRVSKECQESVFRFQQSTEYGVVSEGVLRKVWGNSAEIMRKVRGNYVLLRQEKVRKFYGSLRKFRGNLRKISCNDPFPNDPISELLKIVCSGRHFRDFCGIPGPKGPGDPFKGRAGSRLLDVIAIFFSLPFCKTARKTTKKARISSACRTPKILGNGGKNARNRKEFLEKEKGKENQKGKEKKIRVLLSSSRFIHHVMRSFAAKSAWKTKQMITSHDVLEPLKQTLWASRDVILSSQTI